MDTSELILNRDGSIYHLNLQPEQVAPLIITVGDPDRVAKVSRNFDRVEYRVRKREFLTHTGWLGNKRLSVISTGIGTDNVDIVLNELDALFNIDLAKRQPKARLATLTFIRIGTAGSLQKEIDVDSFVVSSGAVGLDGLVQFYQAGLLQNHPLLTALRAHASGQWDFPLSPYFAEGDRGLLQHFSQSFHPGITATNAGFYGPQGRRLRAPVRFPGYLDMLQSFEFQGKKIVNLEMETAAIYGLANLLGASGCLVERNFGQPAWRHFQLQPGKNRSQVN